MEESRDEQNGQRFDADPMEDRGVDQVHLLEQEHDASNPSHNPRQLIHVIFGKIPRQPPVLEDDLLVPRGSMTLIPSRDTAGGMPRKAPELCPKQCPHYYIASCGIGDAAQLTGRMLRSLGEALWVHPSQSFPPVERSDLVDIKFGDCVLVVQVISPHWINCRTCPTRRCWGRNDEWGIVSTAVPFIIYEDLAAMGDLVQRGTQLWLGPKYLCDNVSSYILHSVPKWKSAWLKFDRLTPGVANISSGRTSSFNI